MTDTSADRAFDLFLRTVHIDQLRLEQATHFTAQEWHALARDRRHG